MKRDKHQSLATQANDWLEEIEISSTKQFVESVQYSYLTPGKRFRGICVQLVGELLHIKANDIKVLCSAIELIHASTLVHDDLPALDNDPLRRGRPTVHVKFGEAIAILAGDALIGESFRMLAAGRMPREVIVRFGEVYRTLCEGQMLDLDV